MTDEYAYYFRSLRLGQHIRWALADLCAATSVRFMRIATRLLPVGHPTKPYLEARMEAMAGTVVPSVSVGLPSWAKRLGQGVAVAALATVCILLAVGVIRTGHHIHNAHAKHTERWGVDLFR